MCKGLDIPKFLQRKRGEAPQSYTSPPSSWSNATTASSWQVIDEQKKRKSRGRVARMKQKLADRAARDSGKTWDANKGLWR
jgi:hypothetical protein